MRNRVLCLLLAVFGLFVPLTYASNDHGLRSEARERSAWFNDLLSPVVVSGCDPATSGSTTVPTFACNGYVSTGPEMRYVSQATSAVGPLNSGDGTYWLAIHKNRSGAVASWTRHGITHYLWQKSATQPATPAGALLFSKVTVSGAVITATASLAFFDPAKMGYINVLDPQYGVVADGVTDDFSAIYRAEAAAVAQGKKLWFPGGKSYAFDGQLGVRVSVHSNGAILVPLDTTPNEWWQTIGNWHIASGTQNDDLEFRGFTVAGNGFNMGVYLENCKRCLVENVHVTNAINSGIRADTFSDNVEIRNNYINGVKYIANGTGGSEGIYVAQSENPIIENNVITDFRRIGIVIEGDTDKSSFPRISRNHITNANNSDDSPTEYNGCIWLENTNGGTVDGNFCWDIAGNAGQTSLGPRGITFGLGNTTPDRVNIRNNDIDMGGGSIATSTGIAIGGAGNFGHMLIDGNKVAYTTTGISMSTLVGDVTISNNLFDQIDCISDTQCVIVQAGITAGDLTIRDNTLKNITKTDADAQDLMFITSGGVTKLIIDGMRDMGIATGGTNASIREMSISNSLIQVGTSTNTGAFEAGTVYLYNVEIEPTAGRTENLFKTSTVGTTVFCNACIFDGIDSTIGGDADSTFHFINSHFINGSNLSFDQTLNSLRVFIAHSYFLNYDTTNGALKANLTAASTTEFYLRNNFFSGTTVEPLQLWTNNPDVVVLEGNAWGGTLPLSNFTLAGLHYARNFQSNGFVAFADADATPSIQGVLTATTANTGATTITAFDACHIGQEFTVLINDANTIIDFTGTTIKGNAGVDLTGAVGDKLECLCDGTNAYCTVSES